MIEKEEQLKVNLQRKVIDKIVEDLFSEFPELYYTATVDIARLVEDKIKSPNYLSKTDLELVEDLSVLDIQNSLGYASSCC